MRIRTAELIVGVAGALLVGGAVALQTLAPQAIADEIVVPSPTTTVQSLFKKPLDGGRFVKVPETVVEPWVQMEATSEVTVRKIAYGRTSFVSVMTTQTGTYSSDGLASPHVLYPGIHMGRGDDGSATVLAMLEDGGWLRISRGGAGSIVTVTPLEDGGRLTVRR